MFADEMVQALCAGREQACRLGERSVKVEHLLLGALQMSHCKGALLLRSLGIHVVDLVEQLEKESRVGDVIPSPPSAVHLSAGARYFLKSAAREATDLRHLRVSTAHLLLSIARDPLTAAGSILAGAGASYGRLRGEITDD
jgi:ATP-dependent Clp protease ATP-binding subunit ClpA